MWHGGMDARGAAIDRATYYEELLDEQAESGLSVAEFAEEAGVSAATLYAWRRRLRGQGRTPKVLEVDVVDEESAASRSQAVTLHVDDRFRIELSGDFDEGALVRLLRVLDRC